MREIVVIDGKPVMVDGVEFDQAVAERPVVPASNGDGEPDPIEPQAPSERTTSTKPEDVGWDEWQRRHDSVRTLAREFDEVDHGDIREFLKGRTTRELTDEEVGQIRHDVLAQRVSDIADIFDEQLRSGSERLRRARRTVRVQAPRGWLKRAFNSLDERAVSQVAARLLQRGHDAEAVKSKVIGRMKDEEARQHLEEMIDKGELKLEFADTIEAIGTPLNWSQPTEPLSQKEVFEFALDMAERIAANVKLPEIKVEVPITMAGGTKKVIRNPETKFVEEVVEE